MFQSISWQSYWITLALLSAGYYGVIYLLYYRSDFKIWVHRRSSLNTAPFPEPGTIQGEQPHSTAQPSLFDDEDSLDFQSPQAGTAEGVVYSCLDELTAFFVAAKSRKWAKEELVQALQGILLKYPSLKDSSYKESLSNVIATQCEQYCSIHLRVEDTRRVWLAS